MIDNWQRWVARLLIAVGAGLLLWVAAYKLMTASDRRQYDVTLEDLRVSAGADPGRTAPERFIVRDERIS